MTESLVVAEHERMDLLEQRMLAEAPVVDCPVVHTFTTNLYSRRITMPAGTLITSKIHKTRHQFVVLTGKVSVYIPGEGVQHIEAPYCGVTEAGTRRALYIHEDCDWITFHPLEEGEEGNLEMIENRIIERRELPDGSTAFDHYQRLLAEARIALLGEAA